MKILSAKFIKSVAHINQIPFNNIPEIAFAGRSNVGKSTLINCLINRKNLAQISSSPGKTRLINYYLINENLFFVDLPGYGFAKVSQKERGKWKILIESYLMRSQNLKGVVQIIDSRIGPTDLDIKMISWLNHLNIPILVISTKSDKLSKIKSIQYLKNYVSKLESYGISNIIPFSSITKIGIKEVWKEINSLLTQC